MHIIIIGAGLSGLYLGNKLLQQGHKIQIIDSRDRIGGRINTILGENGTPIDLGATWFWDENVFVKKLIEDLSIGYFEQKMEGDAVFRSFSTQPSQRVQVPEQNTSYRVEGGTIALLNKLYEDFKEFVALNETVKQIIIEDGVSVITQNKIYQADKVIVTIPPALFIESVSVSKSFSNRDIETFKGTHTWMKDSGKVAIEYNKPFWKEQGFSGTMFSNTGPLSELYEHNDFTDEKFAICGFVNTSFFNYEKEERVEAITNQLVEAFGTAASEFIGYHELNWSLEPFTTTTANPYLHPHQNNGHLCYQSGFHNNKLYLSGTETAPQFGGYMEGAIRAANRTLDLIKTHLKE